MKILCLWLLRRKAYVSATMVDSKCSASESEDYATLTNQSDDTMALQVLPPRESSPFEVGEIVIVSYQNSLYEAKVLKIRFKSDKWSYYIHYSGWNKSWDEWVGVERVLKLTEENIQLMHDLKKKKESPNNANVRSAVQPKPNADIESRCKKRRIDSSQVDKGSSPTEKHLNIYIPPTLKKLLIEDSESRTRGELVKLPRSPNLRKILYDYRIYRFKGGLFPLYVEDIVKGLCGLFDMTCRTKLLYENERQQYEEAIIGDLTPSGVYGAEHLLRLIVKLPELIQHLKVKGKKIKQKVLRELNLTIADFLEFFEMRQTDFYPPLVIGLD